MSEVHPDNVLRKGIRAARLGKNEAAQSLLVQVVRADPKNEEAWLWLSRITEEPEKRTKCLERVLLLNPDNRWAAEQLQSLRSPAPQQAESTGAPREQLPQPSPSSNPETSLELELVACPNCGAPLNPNDVNLRTTLECSHCQEVIELRQKLRAHHDRVHTPRKPIKPGMECTFNGERYQVVGWICYRGEDDEEIWEWDEWLLVSSKGFHRWLSYDPEEGFLIQRKIATPKAFNPAYSHTFPVPGGTAVVVERSHAYIKALKGELPWKAKLGEEMSYVEAKRGKYRYSVEYSIGEIEVYEGQPLSEVEVWEAFGRKDLLAKAQNREERKSWYEALAGICIVLALISGAFSMLVSIIGGRDLSNVTLPLDQAQSSWLVGPVELKTANRPYRIILRTSLPTNSWAIADVTIIDSEDNEYYLFSYEFWDEEGRDSEGHWHESNLKTKQLFVPDTSGSYYFEVALDETTVSAVNLSFKLEGPIWATRFLNVFAIASLLCAYCFYSLAYDSIPILNLFES